MSNPLIQTGIQQFTLFHDSDPREFSEKIIEFFKNASSSLEEAQFTCLDTFDWQLYRKNISVESIKQGRDYRLHWRTFSNSQPILISRVKKASFFASDLPPGRFRDELNYLIGVRILLPQVKMRIKRYIINQLNKDEKTILRVFVNESRLYIKNLSKYVPLENRVEIIPIRGYDKYGVIFSRYLRDKLNMAESGQDLLTVALDKLALDPMQYVSSTKVQLTSEMTVGQAARTYLNNALKIMKLNEKGILDDLDSEFLHNYRVSMRKMRSLLKQIEGILPQQTTEYILKNLAWLGAVTGPVRDMDVYLLKYEEFYSMLPTELQSGLAPLRELLESKKQIALKHLQTVITGKRYQTFMKKISLQLENPIENQDAVANMDATVKVVADKQIWKSYKRVINEGKVIGIHHSAEALHELRKSCKKLRYLIEVFQSLYANPALKRLVNSIKTLQENLGELNDLHVQIEHLKAFEKELDKDKHLSAETHQSISFLIRTLMELQQKEKEKFVDTFAAFNLPELRKDFKRLFNS